MNHVKDLPSSDDLISTRALVSEISRQLSVARNWIKKKIQESVKKSRYSKKIRNIGALAAAIIGTYPFPATVAFYMRVAYIRWHVVHRNHEAQDFWPNVDVGLEKLRAEGDLKFVIALDICYKDDIKKYGDPAVSGFSSGELDSSTDNWVRTINDLAPRIKPNSHGVKRTRDQDDDDDEEESINGDGED